LTSTTQITVTIQGANDAPTAVVDTATAVEAGGLANGTAGMNPTGNVLTNDTDVDAGDTKAVSGVASGAVGSASGNVGSLVVGSFGSINISADGSYTYTVDNTNAAVQALRISGQTLSETFTYQMTDTGGLSALGTVTITIQGSNDNPVGIADTGTATESGGYANATVGSNATGNLLSNDTDVDSVANGETKTVTGIVAGTFPSAVGNVGSSVTGTYGAITIGSNGAYTYVIDETNATVQALRLSSQTITDVFTYTVTDTGGLTSTTQVTITIQGGNDAPVGVDETATAAEAGGLSNGTAGTNPTGNLLTNDTDVDSAGNGETKTVTAIAAGSVANPLSAVGTVTGTYGSINIAANGAYTYTVDNTNAAVQALRLSGQTLSETFTYRMADAGGLTSLATVTITIQGANDTPVPVNDTNTAVEAGGVSNGTAGTNPTGNVLTNDTDVDSVGNGETKTVSGVAAGSVGSAIGTVGTGVTGTYGSINIAANGSYTYTVDNTNAAVQALRISGQALSETFTYQMTDTGGLSALGTVTITIQGANDNPVGVVDTGTATEASGYANATAGSNATGNVLTNDTDVDSVGNGETKTVSGIVAGTFPSAVGNVGTSVTGTYGAITIGSTGAFTYLVDETNATVQALRLNSQTITDVFTYTVTDTGGLTSTTQVTVTIQGGNDAPVGVDDAATATEAGGLANGTAGTNPTGNLLTNDTDVDSVANGETKTITAIAAGSVANPSGALGNLTGTYGSINIAANGTYTYTVDNTNAAVQALRLSGQTLSETFTYRMADAGGLTSLATVTITIQGANDTPVANNETNTAVEAGGLSNGTAGTNSTGNVLTNDTDIDSVANGETKTVTGVVAGSVGSAVGSVGSSVTGTYGSINISSTGAYTYTVDNTNAVVQALRLSGQTLSETFTYAVTDAGGLSALGTVTINIQGANDNPVGVVDTGTATEASGINNATAGSNATGNVLTNDTDVDSVGNGETKTVSGVVAGVAGSASGMVGSSVTGNYGAITIGSNGAFTYIVDETNATVQALRLTSQTITDVFTYTVTDTGGLTSTTQVTITIQGANDAPIASNDATIAVEAGGLANGTAGTSPSGNALTNDSDVDSTANGETKTFTGVAAGAQASATGSVGSSVTGNYGSITIGANGAYTYSVDNNNAEVQALRLSGQTLTDLFTYTMADTLGLTSTSTITVTIQGANDTPVTTNDTNTAVEAGGVTNDTAGVNPTGNVLANDSDVDSVSNGETKTVTGVVAGSQSSAAGSVGSSVTGIYGAITIAANGSYTYTVDNSNPAVQALRLSGQTLSETFTYEMTDTGGLSALGTVTINIQGANDNPVGIADTGTATEASGYANATAGTNATGNVLTNDTDVDSVANGETKTVTGVVAGVTGSATGSVGNSVTGNYGAITIGANGSFTYVVDEANATVQALRLSSQTITDVFTYTVTDTGGLTATTQVTVTIQGANDAPVSSDDNTIAVEAGGLANGTPGNSPSGNVLANDSDVDATANGETKTVTGVAAGAQANAIGSVGSSVTGSYGSITIGANGAYTYTIDNNNAAVQALRLSGQTLSDIFTYTMADTLGLTSTSTITVTIQGANDTPVTTNDTDTAVEAGGVSNGTSGTNPTGNVLANDSDVDSIANSETKTITGVVAGSQSSATGSVGSSVTGIYGSITIASDGSYSYTVDNSNPDVQSLRLSGQTLSETFTYEMTDAGGLSALGTVTINIQGANDNPVGIADAGTATEAGGYANATAGSNATGNVLSNDTDVDSIANGETKTVTGVVAGVAGNTAGSVGSSVVGNYGAITIGANGSFTYVVDETNATVQALRLSSQTITDVFTYTVTDTGGLTSTTQVTITIQGANDAPVSSDDNTIAVEAGGLSNGTAGTSPSGNVLANDSDVDSVANGETKTVTGVAAGTQANASGLVGSSVTGLYGSITIGANGAYTYSVDNNNAAVQALRLSGQTLSDIFTYTMADTLGLTSTSTITVTIQGANDTPVTSDDTNTAIEDGGVANGTSGTNPTGNVLTNDSDVDSVANGETKTVTGVVAGSQSSATGSVGSSVTGIYGSITIASDGSYSYTVDNSNPDVQSLLLSGQTLSETFTYEMTDTGGLSALGTVTINIQGANDNPVGIADVGAATEASGYANSTAGSNATGNVLANDTDVDSVVNGETKTVTGVVAGVASSASGHLYC
jgi:VCBS repeat-containing protein